MMAEDQEEKAMQMFNDGIFPEVHVRWGEPGTGKSKYVFDKHPPESIYTLNIERLSDKSVWWDGYTGQEVILLRDFDGELGWKYLLRLLDRYPFRMQARLRPCWRLCRFIYITSRYPPERWYHQIRSKQLLKSLTTVTHQS